MLALATCHPSDGRLCVLRRVYAQLACGTVTVMCTSQRVRETATLILSD